MSVLRPERRSKSLAPLLFALSAAGCYDSGPTYVYSYAPAPVVCNSGVSDGSVDTDAILDLDPGRGVGATVEYAGEGTWRFALACDSLVSGYVCNWNVIVTPLDGTIDAFDPEKLEPEDLIERYPSSSDSREEDAVLLAAVTADDIDAFTMTATPGVGMRVDANVDGYCAGPYLFWTDSGNVRSSSTNPTDLFPAD